MRGFVGLGLQEADAQIELVGDVDVLVLLRKGADEGGVVGADLGDVGVFAAAVFGVAVAGCWWCCGRWWEQQIGCYY